MSDHTSSDEPKKRGWFRRMTEGLTRSSSKLTEGVTSIFTKRKLDATTLEELEDLLISSDLGVTTAARICEALSDNRYDKEISPDEVRRVLAEEVTHILDPVAQPLTLDASKSPHVILMVGVNGTGKTTTIGKLAAQFKHDGKKVMLAAADTFRAAAIDQIKVWGARNDCPVIAKDVGSDASGVAYEAVETAQRDGMDVLMIDTAGRLQNKAHLMEELEKIHRVIQKLDDTAPHSVLLVLDATTGQNAISQVQAFKEAANITGLVMTKLDGTARGGILVALTEKFGLPIHAIGVGEGIDDLQAFEAAAFAEALTGSGEII